MENKFSENYFQLTRCFAGFDPKIVWSENFHFKPFPDSRTKRERERESPDHSLDRAPIWRPKELQSDDHKPVSSHHATLAPIHTSTNQAKINSNAARSCLYRVIWWIFFSGFCFTCVSIWPNLMNFFLGFVSFVFLYWGMILYICLAAEKMYSISRKCVFYGIFKNTTKYQKIFFKTFFKMQPNTWKYFPFPKIAFPENILHEPNTALNMTYGLGLYICV